MTAVPAPVDPPPSVRASTTVSGALADVKIGDRIAVQGPQAGDGTY
jgi:hypothetical protein